MKSETQKYRDALEYVREQLFQIPGGPDMDADEMDTRPEDVAQHIAGLCIRKIDESLND